jgi:hypothetical protein
MDYISPSLQDLHLSLSQIKKVYFPAKLSARATLMDVLQSIDEFVREGTLDFNDPSLAQAIVGAWIACFKSIYKTYRFPYLWSPENSDLFRLLKEALRLSKKNREIILEDGTTVMNELSEKKALEYILMFYHLLFSENATVKRSLQPLYLKLRAKQVDLIKLRQLLISTIQKSFDNLEHDVEKIMKAIPKDETIHRKVSDLHNHYTVQKEKQRETSYWYRYWPQDQSRYFTAQMGEAITHALPPDDRGEELSLNQHIRMGALLYIMESVQSGELYDLCAKALQLEKTKLKHFDSHTKLECLLAFKEYVNLSSNLNVLENYGKYHFKENNQLKSIHVKISTLRDDLEKMIHAALQNERDNLQKQSWPATYYLGTTGEILLSAPFFGLGCLAGMTASSMNMMVRPMIFLGNAFNVVGTNVFGLSHSILGLMVAKVVTEQTLMRAFGKTFEAVGKKLGYLTLGLLVGTPLDLVHKAVNNYCRYNLYLYEHYYDPVLMKNVDVDFLRCLRNLPSEIFAEDKKALLMKFAQENNCLESQPRLGLT